MKKFGTKTQLLGFISTSEACFKLFRFILTNKGESYITEISKKLKISLAPTNEYVRHLENAGILKRRKEKVVRGQRTMYSMRVEGLAKLWFFIWKRELTQDNTKGESKKEIKNLLDELKSSKEFQELLGDYTRMSIATPGTYTKPRTFETLLKENFWYALLHYLRLPEIKKTVVRKSLYTKLDRFYYELETTRSITITKGVLAFQKNINNKKFP